MHGGFLSSCRLLGPRREEVLISHLLFADETLVFIFSGVDVIPELNPYVV